MSHNRRKPFYAGQTAPLQVMRKPHVPKRVRRGKGTAALDAALSGSLAMTAVKRGRPRR
jgi:hypothetical protein